MPDTKPKTRNAKSTLSVGQALDRIRERLRTQPERESAHARQFLMDEAEWLGKVAARVPEDQRASLAAMLNAVGAPTRGFQPFAAEGPPDDAEPVYTAERMQTELSPERKKIAGMK